MSTPSEVLNQLPFQNRFVTFQPATINEEARTVDVMWSSGAPAIQYGVIDGEYQAYEELLTISEENVRLGRLNLGAAVLDNHNHHGSVVEVLGVTLRAWIENGFGYATLEIARSEIGDKVWQLIRDKIVRSCSVYYRIYAAMIERSENDRVRLITTDIEEFGFKCRAM